MLGEGSYATVKEAFSKGKLYALKILDKSMVISHNELKNVFREKTVLSKMDHPAVVRLYMTAQDDRSLYFLLEYCARGELWEHIRRLGRFSEPTARFYTAEILSGLEHIHSHGIVHRDIKPENLLLDESWHVKITDFGTAKEIGEQTERHTLVRSTFVGTSHYLSPEILNEDKVSTSSDLWALGCVVYQMLVGKPPFSGPTDYVIFRQIRENNVHYPPFVSDLARSLISQLLQPDASKRLRAEQIREHPWFEGFNWENLHLQQPPPMVAPIELVIPSSLSGSFTDLRTQPQQRQAQLQQSQSQSQCQSQSQSQTQQSQSQSQSRPQDRSIISASSSTSPLDIPNKTGAEGLLASSAPVAPSPPLESTPSRGTSTSAPPLISKSPPLNTTMSNSSPLLGPLSPMSTAMHSRPMSMRGDDDYLELVGNPWEKYLKEGELVAFKGTVQKRTGLVVRTRELFLIASATPRLFYIDPATGELKGEINLTPDVQVRLHSRKERNFKLITTSRIYHLSALTATGKEWQNHIYLLSEHSRRTAGHYSRDYDDDPTPDISV